MRSSRTRARSRRSSLACVRARRASLASDCRISRTCGFSICSSTTLVRSVHSTSVRHFKATRRSHRCFSTFVTDRLRPRHNERPSRECALTDSLIEQNNNIGADGARCISDLLQSNSTITQLDLGVRCLMMPTNQSIDRADARMS